MTFSYHISLVIYSSLRYSVRKYLKKEKKIVQKNVNHMKNDKVVRKGKENQSKNKLMFLRHCSEQCTQFSMH